MKIALGQINPTIGDFDGNLALIVDALTRAEAEGADLLVLPELALSGYPPRDLLERPAFMDAAGQTLTALTQRVGRTAVVVGFPERLGDDRTGRSVANAAALIDGGRIVSVHRKSLLPTYDVFDEWRYFEPAASVTCAELRGRRVGISVCEDVWNDADFWPKRLYRDDPIEKLVAGGAEVIINISASPYSIQKRHLRPRMLANTARHWQRPLVFVNQVGGQDDLVFDGASLVFDEKGEVIARGPEMESAVIFAEIDTPRGVRHRAVVEGAPSVAFPSDARSALNALTLGTRDYARRCGFETALVGLSGGIDSAVVACIAADALGPGQVLGVAMPSRYSSQHSLDDAAALAKNLGIPFRVIPVEPVFASYLDTLAPFFKDLAPDATEENLQARIRGALLMSLSNKFSRLLLTTGNKSELATGYCTLYGDMCGGLAIISDAPKTLVYQLARELNAQREVIPRSTLTKPPSAELRPDQTDQDTLPPYEVLDAILEAHIEQGLDAAGLIAAGFDATVVNDVVRRVRLSEYKRRQMPPGLKITGKAFGPGRRYPIAQAFRG